MTTTEYPNYGDNSTGTPNLAFITCSDPETTIREMALRCGVPMEQAIFLSAKDDPGLGTPAGILSALPPSITWLLIINVEFLLPERQRNRSTVHALMAEFGRLGDLRGIVVDATHGLGSPPTLVVSVHSLRGGEA